MIETLFLILLALALLLVGLGYAVSEGVYSIVGFIFLFILSTSILIPGNLEHKIGTNTTTSVVYGDNFSGDHWDYTNPPAENPSLDPLRFHEYTTATDLYENYSSSSQWFGIWLALISLIGAFISSVETFNDQKEVE